MREFDVEQGSSEWHDLRKGVVTASRMHRIMTPKTMRLSAQADGLIAELIGEKFSLIPEEGVENFTNRAIRWGEQMEAEARRWYEMERNVSVRQTGFCLRDDGLAGCSPDGLIDPDGILELKCPQHQNHVAWLLAGTLPDEHAPQCHGALIVTERKWIDFLSYCPGLPPLLVRVAPSEYTQALRKALTSFHARYMDSLARVNILMHGEEP